MLTTRLPIVRSLRVLSVCAGACVALSLSGCVGYNVYPPMEGEKGFTNVNSDPFPPVITQSLKWVVLRYPPSADAEMRQPAAGNVGVENYAVNLPRGLSPLIATSIVKQLGAGAQPMVPGNEHLPTYHISRIQVTGDDAKVDIVRPVVGLAFSDEGKAATQGVTVRLRGGLKQWTVTSHRLWSFNSLQPPALNYIVGTTPGDEWNRPAQPGFEMPAGTQPDQQPPAESSDAGANATPGASGNAMSSDTGADGQ